MDVTSAGGQTRASVPRGAALINLTVAVLTIVVWRTGSQILKDPLHTNFMAPNTALCLIAASLALILLTSRAAWTRLASVPFALFVSVAGWATLLEYALKTDFGIDRLFMGGHLVAWTAPNILPGRFAPNTALAFAFLGPALLTREVRFWRFRLSEILVLPALMVAFLSLVGYLYHSEALYGIGSYSSMALHTALCLGILALGVLWAGADSGMMGLILSHDAGGITARRMLLATLLILPIMGWIETRVQARRILDPQLDAALLVIVSVTVFSFMILRTSLTLRDFDEQRRRAEELLRRSHTELETQVVARTSALRRLSARLMELQDEERRRIARELHDGLGQYLTALAINMDRIEQQPGASRPILAECKELVARISSEVRTMSHLLHPPLLDEVGFASAARWFVEGFANRSGMQVNLDLPDSLPRLPLTAETGLFRLLQEGLTNIHRHSNSKQADISLRVEGASLCLSIRDYGKGIAPEVLERWRESGNAGVGLTGMRERAAELGGHLEISCPTPGTLLTVTLPMQDATLAQQRATA